MFEIQTQLSNFVLLCVSAQFDHTEKDLHLYTNASENLSKVDVGIVTTTTMLCSPNLFVAWLAEIVLSWPRTVHNVQVHTDAMHWPGPRPTPLPPASVLLSKGLAAPGITKCTCWTAITASLPRKMSSRMELLLVPLSYCLLYDIQCNIKLFKDLTRWVHEKNITFDLRKL